MREPLLAWAGDCVVEGSVDLGEGRLSDQVNEREVVTFFDVTLHALDDGHEVAVDELEVGRGELHVIAVQGRRGDPSRRLRTVEERVTIELGPFVVTGNLHRPPSTAPLASLSRWQRFVPMTDALVGFKERDADPVAREVVLVNRDRIARTIPIAAVPVFERERTTPPA
jgi:hypothetical protein